MTVILIGYMGSGKSTIGQMLSKVLKFDFVDLDAYIEEKEGQSIPEVFNTKGEIYFRKKENQYLKEVVNRTMTVISLGGGTPCYGNNMEVIVSSEDAMSIYLKASIPTLVERLIKDKNNRPLISHLNTELELTEFIGKHIFERSFYYSQANTTITVDDKSIKEIVEEIVLELF